ncbi:MAG: 1-acyl-sn-glycerol-3-phosphate acyltransferase [Corynebacteriales bacterium]|nr:1-acyl-sn-glycerol-3-phosphate acyltransferase [Mycobacteriales bacterium]
MVELVYPPVIALARAVFAAQGLKFNVQGSENVPRTGGAIMAINHIGYFDFTYAGLAARPAKRLVRFMAKQEVFKHPIGGPLLRGMKHIPVDRKAGSSALNAATQQVMNGEIVGVFPEATISMSFELKEFMPGAALIAKRAAALLNKQSPDSIDTQIPVLPVIVWGSQRVWTKGKPRRLGRTNTPITIQVGKPMMVNARSNVKALTSELHDDMEQLLHRVQEAYPDQPRGVEDSWWLPARLGGTAPTPEAAAVMEAEIAARREEKG